MSRPRRRWLSFAPMVIGVVIGRVAVEFARAGWSVWLLGLLVALVLVGSVIGFIWLEDRLDARSRR